MRNGAFRQAVKPKTAWNIAEDAVWDRQKNAAGTQIAKNRMLKIQLHLT